MSLPAEYFSHSPRLRNQDGTRSTPASLNEHAVSQWKQQLANATRSVADLLGQLELSEYINKVELEPDFKCLATDNYIRKMQKGDINDPLLQQVLPLKLESHQESQRNGIIDPVGDINSQVTPGLLHKYHGRVLFISTGACAIHCRYCFRRSYPYQQSSCTGKVISDAVEYLNQHVEVEEVILSGGDPLTLDNEKLAGIISTLEIIDHIKILRIHTRIPVVLPDRIDNVLLQILKFTRLQVVMVIHANHANELQHDEYVKLHLLNDAGITLLNQSVLLKGINDNADSLVALSKRLFQCRTLPYYLHLLDPASGAMHYEVNKNAALRLKSRMDEQLPGYLVPRLVREVPENSSKTAISYI